MGSYFPSNLGYIGIASQNYQRTTAKTTAKVFVAYDTEGIAPEWEDEILIENSNGKYKKNAVKTLYKDKIMMSCYARPKQTSYLVGCMFGKDTVSAGAVTTPTTHTFTIKTTDLTTTPCQKWLTVEKKVNSTNVHRCAGVKFNSLTIEGEAGKPIKITAEGTGLSSVIRTTVQTDTYETDNPFSFYNGVFLINTPTTSNFDIKSFNIKITAKNDEAIQTTGHTRRDIINHQYDVEVTLGLFYTDFTMFKKANFAAGTSPSTSYSDGSVRITATYGSAAARRKMDINIPRVVLKPHAIQNDAAVKTLEQPLSGMAFKQSTTELITVVMWNSVTTTMPN